VQTITGGTNWKLISSGTGAHAAAIKTDGTLWTWGSDNYGQLGDNSVTNKSSPVQTITGGTNWQQVSIGGYHTMAIKTDGTLWTWGGFNLWGQLGVNDTVNRSSPIQTVTGGTNWKSISAGQYHSIAIKTDGTMWGFGSNGYGALGDGSGVHRSSPVQAFGVNTTWKQVSAARDYTVAIRSDNTLWTCGNWWLKLETGISW
jgi:alpha-tubulin suppressor-like RCC1 family protein